MFELVEIEYRELEILKDDFDLELRPLMLKGTQEISKILFNKELVGVVALSKYSNGILVDHFEILKSKQNQKIGRKFVLFMKKQLFKKGILYITPLPEAEEFWKRCGFTEWTNERSMMYCSFDYTQGE